MILSHARLPVPTRPRDGVIIRNLGHYEALEIGWSSAYKYNILYDRIENYFQYCCNDRPSPITIHFITNEILCRTISGKVLERASVRF